MKILVVSGFLGAGKTTFIKELIRRTGTFPVVLENEYGQTDLDARELSRVGDLKILEFMEGCVCCTMKDDFLSSVLTISSALDPEYLIVEPSGVGKLSGILSTLRKICYDRIQLLRPVVVLSPRSIGQNLSEWPDIFRDQIANADVVVFSKSENNTPEELAQAASLIAAIRPEAQLDQRHYSQFDEDWWYRLLDIERKDGEITASEQTEQLEQMALFHARLDHIGQLVCLLEDMLRGAFGQIARGKGVLPVGDHMLRFDLADGLYAITGTEEEATQCVFIGSFLEREPLCARLNTTMPGVRPKRQIEEQGETPSRIPLPGGRLPR